MINRNRLANSFRSMAQLWGPSKEEKVIADRVVAEFKAMKLPGATVRIDDTASLTGCDTGNVLFDIPASEGAAPDAPGIGLFFHMDRVPARAAGVPEDEPVQLVTEPDGTIHSKNYRTNIAGDDRAGYAEIKEALEVVKENNLPHGRILVVGFTSEESDPAGSEVIDAHVFDGIQAGFAVDSLDPVEVVRGAASITTWRASFAGKSAHSGMEPQKGISAIQGANVTINGLAPLGFVKEGQTMNVGTIQGGTVTNAIPDACAMAGEYRSVTEEDTKELDAKLTSALARAEEEVGVKTTLERAIMPGFFLAEDEPVVRLALEGVRNAGFQPTISAMMGGSDANFLNVQKGLPTVLLGSGVFNEHTVQEHVKEADLEKAARVVLGVIQAAAQGSHILGGNGPLSPNR